MGNHSDPVVTQPISTDQALAEKLRQLACSLQTALATDFKQTLGVEFPISAPLAIRDYDLVGVQASLASVLDGYETGAAATVPLRIASEPLQEGALVVVRSVLGYAAGLGRVAVGGYACSAVTAVDGQRWVSAVFCEVEFCSGRSWSTPVDFNIISFAFAVWLPAPGLVGPSNVTEAVSSAFPGSPPTVRYRRSSGERPADPAASPLSMTARAAVEGLAGRRPIGRPTDNEC